jgi:predicted acyltransferase
MFRKLHSTLLRKIGASCNTFRLNVLIDVLARTGGNWYERQIMPPASANPRTADLNGVAPAPALSPGAATVERSGQSGSETNASAVAGAGSQRLLSLDALRGFDMFWLLGGEQIIHGLCAGASEGSFALALNDQFEHVKWEGFHFYDFIFPLFLFLIGVAISFSVEKRRARGESSGMILRHACVRFCGMVFIGFFTTGHIHSWNMEQMGLSYSVLMMLGFGYMIAMALVLYTSLRTQIVTVAGILIAYWALQMFVRVPGHSPGEFKLGAIFSDWLYDHSVGLLGKPWKSRYGRGFPVTLWNHGATAMLGVFAARILRQSWEARRKLKWLLAAGVGCLLAGALWSLHLPIVKNRWTSSYVLWCGGLSYLLLALFWWLIDVRGWRRGLGLWLAIGANSILAYIMAALLMPGFKAFAGVFLGSLKPLMGDYWHNLLMGLASYGLAWGVLACLRRQRIYLRV